MSPSAKYSPAQGVAQADFDEPGLFNTRGSYKSDDRVHGTIGQTPFEAAEVRRSYSTGGKNSTTIVVFHGLFFHLDFNKSLRGTTIVYPEDARPTQLGSRAQLTKVALENPDFEQAFAVQASDEVEARYILTPAMMEQILALRQRAGKPIFLAFKGNRAYIGVHYGRALFEPGIASSTSLESIQEMAAHFALAEGVIHELDLNTRIWTKGVDDSLLKRAVGDEPEDELDRIAAKGELTASQLWATATKAVTDDGADDDGAAVTRPAEHVDSDRAQRRHDHRRLRAVGRLLDHVLPLGGQRGRGAGGTPVAARGRGHARPGLVHLVDSHDPCGLAARRRQPHSVGDRGVDRRAARLLDVDHARAPRRDSRPMPCGSGAGCGRCRARIHGRNTARS